MKARLLSDDCQPKLIDGHYDFPVIAYQDNIGDGFEFWAYLTDFWAD